MKARSRRSISIDKVLIYGVFALMLCGVSGCAELRLNDSDVEKIANEFSLKDSDIERIATTLAEVLPLTVCEGNDASPRNKTIDILFVNKGSVDEPVWCPHSQVETCPQTYNGKNVSWRSVAEDEEGAVDPVVANFTIFVSPLANGSIGSGGSAIAGPRPLNQKAPDALYKYTVAPATITEDCPALDPNFWVND